MKIYLPNLEELISQAVEPVYLIRSFFVKEDYMKQHIVNVTAYNAQDKVLEFRAIAGETADWFSEKEAFENCLNLEKEARETIVAAGMKCLAGYINDQPLTVHLISLKNEPEQKLATTDFAPDVTPPELKGSVKYQEKGGTI